MEDLTSIHPIRAILFIVLVFVCVFSVVGWLLPAPNEVWTGFENTPKGKVVPDSSHKSLEECRRYVQSHSGGFCGLECKADNSCKQRVEVPSP